MNVLFLVIDSLRFSARFEGLPPPSTPSFESFDRELISFRRAYAAECWTLPSHCSMFTGLLPSEHGAHFQSMAYRGTAPTVAEILSDAGAFTEVVSRNFMFDGSITGITRGFQELTRPIRTLAPLSPFALILALNKPRSRRLMKSTAFFHAHREKRRFLTEYSRALLPADDLALQHVLERMDAMRRAQRNYFIFCNLYDVHWPYPPRADSVLDSFDSIDGCINNLLFPVIVPSIGSHGYLREGFHLRDRSRRMLQQRYRRAVELADERIGRFFRAARDAGMLDDTVVVITSDHGEAFGEHDLYLHDASVYDVHLHVPLWIHHPERPAEVVDDVVSTRDLFSLLVAIGLDQPLRDTILDPSHRAAQPIALAEHFYYPHLRDALPRYRQNLAAAIMRDEKLVVRRDGFELFDTRRDHGESAGVRIDADAFGKLFHRAGAAADRTSALADRLQAWQFDAARAA